MSEISPSYVYAKSM